MRMRLIPALAAAIALATAVASPVDAKPSRKAFLGQEVAALTQLCVANNFAPAKVAAALAKRGFAEQPWYGKGMIGINLPGTSDAINVVLYMPRTAPCTGIKVAPVRIPFVTGTMAATLGKLGFAEVGRGNQRVSRWEKGKQRVRIDSHFSVNIGSGVSQSGIAIRPDTN